MIRARPDRSLRSLIRTRIHDLRSILSTFEGPPPASGTAPLRAPDRGDSAPYWRKNEGVASRRACELGEKVNGANLSIDGANLSIVGAKISIHRDGAKINKDGAILSRNGAKINITHFFFIN